jgi:prepilin-type N-terminal cleavage/methylation domain-containing protein
MKFCSRTAIRSEKGFSMMELMIVITLIGVLSAIALPSFIDYRRNLDYRTTARNVANLLQLAKSQAIKENLEQRVVITQAGYGIQAGDKAYSAGFPTSPTNFSLIPSSVVTTPITTIQFTPRGTASVPGFVDIKDTTGQIRFTVTVNSIGRISITRP